MSPFGEKTEEIASGGPDRSGIGDADGGKAEPFGLALDETPQPFAEPPVGPGRIAQLRSSGRPGSGWNSMPSSESEAASSEVASPQMP